MTRGEFAEAVFTYCHVLGASGTSAERTRLHNRDEKGVHHSAHLVGLARDVIYDELPSLAERRDWAGRLGLILVSETDHDHLQPADWRAG